MGAALFPGVGKGAVFALPVMFALGFISVCDKNVSEGLPSAQVPPTSNISQYRLSGNVPSVGDVPWTSRTSPERPGKVVGEIGPRDESQEYDRESAGQFSRRHNTEIVEDQAQAHHRPSDVLCSALELVIERVLLSEAPKGQPNSDACRSHVQGSPDKFGPRFHLLPEDSASVRKFPPASATFRSRNSSQKAFLFHD